MCPCHQKGLDCAGGAAAATSAGPVPVHRASASSGGGMLALRKKRASRLPATTMQLPTRCSPYCMCQAVRLAGGGSEAAVGWPFGGPSPFHRPLFGDPCYMRMLLTNHQICTSASLIF